GPDRQEAREHEQERHEVSAPGNGRQQMADQEYRAELDRGQGGATGPQETEVAEEEEKEQDGGAPIGERGRPVRCREECGVQVLADPSTKDADERTSHPRTCASTPKRASTKITSLICTWLKLSRKNTSDSATPRTSGSGPVARSGSVCSMMRFVRAIATPSNSRLTKDRISAAIDSGKTASSWKTIAANGG